MSPTNEAPALIDIHEVKRRTTLGKSKIYMLMNEDNFPKNVQISKFKVAWLENEISDWILLQAVKRYKRMPISLHRSVDE